MLEEVVVTARRREESLTDLPLSVAALTSEQMQAQGIYDIVNVGGIVPNVAFQNTDRRGIMAIFIRGVGNDATGALPPVGAGHLPRRPLHAQYGGPDAQYGRHRPH